ncbi:MAG: LptF/LptG family permease [Bacteroidia bacterium]|nr:LptF/LptG family permease [Bacteroidia bacterium]
MSESSGKPLRGCIEVLTKALYLAANANRRQPFSLPASPSANHFPQAHTDSSPMNIIDRYIVKQFLSTFLFILGMVMAIAVMVDVVEKIDDFVEKKPPVMGIIMDYYLNFIPYWGNLLSPIVVFLAVIFFTSRMAGRTEIIAILAGGASFYRLMMPYLGTGIFLAVIAFVLKGFIIPTSTANRVEFEYAYLKKRPYINDRHIHKKVAQDSYLYIGYYNSSRAEGTTVGLEQVKDETTIVKMDARKMNWVDSLQLWQLKDVRIRTFDGLKEKLSFRPKIDTSFLLTPDDIYVKDQKAETMTLPELSHYISLEEMRGSDILRELYIERHRRFSDPVALIILTLIGYAMATRKTRGGVALQIGIGLGICFLYVALLVMGQAFVDDEFPAFVGVWMANFLFLPVAAFTLLVVPK